MRNYLILFLVVGVLLFVIFQVNQRVETAIQYFPPDDEALIDHAETNLDKQDHTVTWEVMSSSSNFAYLRQDVSLLYVNGQFKGVLNKWKQDQENMNMEQTFDIQHDALLQSISFHYGELHNHSDDITSIQKMTSDNLHLFPDEQKEATSLTLIDEQLQDHWQKLMKHYEMTPTDYEIIPLTDLIQYEETALQGQTMEATQKIVGQLWEGLYKNYIVPLSTSKDEIPIHWMPVILIAKDNSHLIVLFEIEGKKHQLKQNISS